MKSSMQSKATWRAGMALVLTLGGAAANAGVITFDEFPATNNNAPLTNLYAAQGVTFGADNSGTWGGLANGDPGNWDLQGTNGSAFLGNNGVRNASTYVTTIFFTTAAANVSLDVARSLGSSAGQSLTAFAYNGATLLGSTAIVFGNINVWTTISLAFAGIDRVVLDGSENGFSPYGVDNLRFATAVPEPATVLLMGLGLLGFVARRKQK